MIIKYVFVFFFHVFVNNFIVFNYAISYPNS